MGIRFLVEQQHQRKDFQLVFSLIAAPEIDYFVGRASDLSSIESVLLPFTAPKRKVAVLHGLGGIGKSQLAIEFAKKHRSDCSAVFWLNSKTEDTLKQSIAANARQLPDECFSQGLLDGPQNEETLGVILQQTKAWLGLPGNDRWLLIYDNVDNPRIPDNKRESAYDIRPYFPEAHQGSIIVTTRWETLRIGCPIKVTKLSKDRDSTSLLIRLAGETICEGEFPIMFLFKPILTLRTDPGIGELITKLDGLPLALATAGQYLGLTGISVSEYLGHYENSWLELQRTSPTPLSYVDQTIYSTWNLSYIYIRKEDPSAAKLLELWAYFDNRDVCYELLKAGDRKAPSWYHDMIGTKLRFNSAIGKLKKHALIEGLTGSDGYSMHHCVHAWIINVLCKIREDENARLAVECIYACVPNVPEPSDWITEQRLLLHAERCSHRLHAWREESKDPGIVEDCIIRLDDCRATLYRSIGKIADSESICKRVLADKERTIGKDHESTLVTVHNLGNIYFDQGKSMEAESMYQRALAGCIKAHGKDHISTFATVNSLGNVYYMQENFAEAESMYQWALVGREKVLGKGHISTLETISNMGLLYSEQGKLTEAESMYQRALIGKEKALGKEHISTLHTVNNLGVLYINQLKLAEAEIMFQRAFAGYTNNPQAKPNPGFGVLGNIGMLYRGLQDYERAKEFFSQAYDFYHSLFGSQHAETIAALEELNIEIERATKEAESSDVQDG